MARLGILWSVALVGCAIPEGRFGCATDDDCPSGFVCRASDDLCWRTGDDAGVDAAGLDVPGLDAPLADVLRPDTAGLDVPPLPTDTPELDAPPPDRSGCPASLVAGECVDVISASFTTCAVRTGGSVRCWGYNGPNAALGDGTTVHTACAEPMMRDCSPTPVSVAGTPGFVAVAGGEEANCARNGSGPVWCWGADLFSGTGRLSPAVAVDLPTGITASWVGMRAPIAVLDTRGQLYVGGTDLQGSGVFGDGMDPMGRVTRALPVATPLSRSFAAVDVGWYHLCAVDASMGAQVLCWGKNTQGECGGDGGADLEVHEPFAVAGLAGATSVAVGDAFSCALLREGNVTCWGWNTRGQLGLGLTAARATASRAAIVPGLTDVLEIDAGFTFACARRRNGEVWCWGSDSDGQLGDGNLAPDDCAPDGEPAAPCARAPVRVASLTDAIDIATGVDYACALRATGEIVCWGDNHFGQLGDGTFTDRDAPVPVFGL